MKFIDCFIFYNELDMLEFRLEYLYNQVSHFVLVESRVDFQGNQKSLYYNDNKDRFNKYNDKIVHIVLDNLHITPIQIHKKLSWQPARKLTPLEHSNSLREQLQRRSIDRGIQQLSLSPDDMIIISDVDEIPDVNILTPRKGSYSLVQDMYYYNLTNKLADRWTLSKMMDYESYMKLRDAQQIRLTNFEHIENAGWHFSYFGNVKYIQFKMQTFGYQTGNSTFSSEEHLIQNSIDNNKDIYNRDIKFIHTPIHDNNYLPPNYKYFIDKYGV